MIPLLSAPTVTTATEAVDGCAGGHIALCRPGQTGGVALYGLAVLVVLGLLYVLFLTALPPDAEGSQ